MVEKKKSVDEAIDEVAEETTGGLSGVKESLAVGRISNMLELVNALQGAGNIIRL